MSNAIKEVTDFSVDITLRSLISAQGIWTVDNIIILGAGDLQLEGIEDEVSTLTSLAVNDVVSLGGLTKILAAGTTITGARITFTRR